MRSSLNSVTDQWVFSDHFHKFYHRRFPTSAPFQFASGSNRCSNILLHHIPPSGPSCLWLRAEGAEKKAERRLLQFIPANFSRTWSEWEKNNYSSAALVLNGVGLEPQRPAGSWAKLHHNFLKSSETWSNLFCPYRKRCSAAPDCLISLTYFMWADGSSCPLMT